MHTRSIGVAVMAWLAVLGADLAVARTLSDQQAGNQPKEIATTRFVVSPKTPA